MDFVLTIKGWYAWFLEVLHHRWIPCRLHPAYLWLVFEPPLRALGAACVIDGDSTLPSKADSSGRVTWPRVVLRPETSGQNGAYFAGWYWLFYFADDDHRCKLWPVVGCIAPRIGDAMVTFRAVSLWGRPLLLVGNDQDALSPFPPSARPV